MAVSVTTPKGVSLSSIKNGDTTVTKTGHYTYTQGTLTLKQAYLSSLENGEVTLTITMSNGDTMSLKITVGE